MNRREALDILERLRPGEDPASSPDEEVRAALSVVEGDEDLAATFARRRSHDRAVAETFVAVDVPGDLHGRLLGVLGLDSAAETPTDPALEAATDAVATVAPRSEGRTSRRGWLAAATAACVGTVAGLAWWFSGLATAPPTLFDYRQQAVTSFEGIDDLPRYDGEARLPWSGWRQGRIDVAPEPRSLVVGGREDRAIAAFSFRIEGHAGVLLAIPTAWLEAAPEITYPDIGGATYTGRFASVAWTERDTTYVCLVDHPATLDLIDRALDVRPA